MFNNMENRKRPRFDMININNNNSNESIQGVASTTTAMGSATFTTIGGQSFIINNSPTTSLPANIYLSICDNSNDSEEEYIIDHSILTNIKQEHTVATQTCTNQNQMQQSTLVALPQYRVINQTGKPLNSSSLGGSSMVNSTTAVNANNSLISNSVQLPAGCEIYVVKEVFDMPKEIIDETNDNNNAAITGCKAMANDNTTSFKIKSSSPLPAARHSTLNGNNIKSLNNNSIVTINSATAVSSTCNTSPHTNDDSAKRSLILEAYKKRDDKRRATHNEVERRRRDKINSWIFKLKEMLPTEVSPSNFSNPAINQNRLSVQPGATTTTRTPSNDSKSQILIKACEYIKSMQEEMNSLRECLTENENLRLNNERLQAEVNILRSKQQKLRHNSNNNILLRTNTTHIRNSSNHNSDNSDNCEITLNSLNTTYANVQLFSPSSSQNNHNHDLDDLVSLTTNSNATTAAPSAHITRSYAKRQLIITDYVD